MTEFEKTVIDLLRSMDKSLAKLASDQAQSAQRDKLNKIAERVSEKYS